MLSRTHAVTFIKTMSSGRTKPCLMLCEDLMGAQDEVVVKLRAGLDTKELGSTSEIIASLLARDLDLPVPTPLLVEIERGFEQAVVQKEVADRLHDSVGWNFGSIKLASGFTTWPKGRGIPFQLRQIATEVFAFDGIIQNPDRRRDNPNILWKNDELFIYDHEMSLAFYLPQIGWQPPWSEQGLEFLKDHVFYDELKGVPLNLDRFAGALETITDDRLSQYLEAVPYEWRAQSDAAEKITSYIGEARQNADGIVSAVKRFLR